MRQDLSLHYTFVSSSQAGSMGRRYPTADTRAEVLSCPYFSTLAVAQAGMGPHQGELRGFSQRKLSGPRDKNYLTFGTPKAMSKRWYSLSEAYAIHPGRHRLHKKISMKQEEPSHSICNFSPGGRGWWIRSSRPALPH